MHLTATQKRSFEKNPGGFIEKIIRDYITNSPNNRFTIYPDEPIWDEPLVGFANGDDPIFGEYKKIIGDYHVTPREALEMYIETTSYGDKNQLPSVSVVSWILPVSEKTRLDNRKEDRICALRWNHTRYTGQECNYRLSRHLVALLEGMGYLAVAPELAKWWEMGKMNGNWSSRWSQRHVAYAAGLGTFGLSDGFITPKGIAIRAGSIVCNLALTPTLRKYAHHYANCLFHSRGICKKCAQRCPAGAITEKGHDKIICSNYLFEMREMVNKTGRGGQYIGKSYLGCGFCQTGVPCENRIPVKLP